MQNDEHIQSGNEAKLERFVVHNMDEIEPGLKFIRQQRVIEVGRIDIEARGADGKTVILELKFGVADESALAQISRYLGWYSKNGHQDPRGVLIAAGFTDGVKYAAQNMSTIKLVEHNITFRFRAITRKDSWPAYFPRKG